VIDSHCHLADDAFAADLDAVVDRARRVGVARVLCIVAAGHTQEAARAARLCELWPDARTAVGVHPHQAGEFAGRVDEVADVVARALDADPAARAVGEIGLDYHYDFAPRDLQREVFRRQVRLAIARGLPVVIHTREARDDTFAVLREEGDPALRGVFHCFTGGPADADRALAIGFHVSFAGIVTFPRAGALREAATAAPPDRLLVETDSPYLAPVPHRGRRNEPAWVAHVIAALAAMRGVTPDALAAQAGANFAALFRP
jgi:TatD DNase family protein